MSFEADRIFFPSSKIYGHHLQKNEIISKFIGFRWFVLFIIGSNYFSRLNVIMKMVMKIVIEE